MDVLEIMKARHSVRQYRGKKIEDDVEPGCFTLIHFSLCEGSKKGGG